MGGGGRGGYGSRLGSDCESSSVGYGIQQFHVLAHSKEELESAHQSLSGLLPIELPVQRQSGRADSAVMEA